jgi:hypothetical protein
MIAPLISKIPTHALSIGTISFILACPNKRLKGDGMRAYILEFHQQYIHDFDSVEISRKSTT